MWHVIGALVVWVLFFKDITSDFRALTDSFMSFNSLIILGGPPYLYMQHDSLGSIEMKLSQNSGMIGKTLCGSS